MSKKIVLHAGVVTVDCKEINQEQNIELGKAVKRIAEGRTQLEDIMPCNNADMREAGCKRWKPSYAQRNQVVDQVRIVYKETETEIHVLAVGARHEDAVYKTASRRFREIKV